MTSFRPKLWTGVGAAVVLAAAVGGCSKDTPAEPAKTAAAAAPAAGEGGEGGTEAGAQEAYTGTPAESRVALRLAHLKGFFLIAQKTTEAADAKAALVGQGMLEVYDVGKGAFATVGLNEAVLRKAADTGSAADLAAAVSAIEAAQAKAGGDPAAVARGMLDIAAGLYKGVITPDGTDTTEYQHSYGAALSAKQAFDAAVKTKPAAKSASADMDKFLAMWPTPEAPKEPTPAAQLSGQAARVELALS